MAPPDDGPADHLPDVDVTLLDATLALSPEERLKQNDRMLATIQELRHGFATSTADDPLGQTGSQRR